MIHEFTHPMPVVTPLGEGYALYVVHNGMLENDEWTVAMCGDGQVRHFTSAQIKVHVNSTYGIGKVMNDVTQM